jgi:Zn-dependent M16 (insulinase) family peptidase
MELKINEKYCGFTLKDSWHIAEIESQAYLFEHDKSAARLLYLNNDDDNKVFFVGFRTPPVDDCGTAHIIEHSVLCGSEKYPLKEPFVELIKSSLHTFLNAMTYPDKTLYPVASKNETDFANLIDGYCDAVFNPLIKHNPYTFYQEGWHYHLEDENDPLTVNGVVYNEMKGVFSDPEEVMMRNVTATLYPDTPYAFESGGDPDKIPGLTYERFMAFYNMYYHPSNSYIYFYGDTDILKHLEALDKNYLSHYEKLEQRFPSCQAGDFRRAGAPRNILSGGQRRRYLR